VGRRCYWQAEFESNYESYPLEVASEENNLETGGIPTPQDEKNANE
jgi:hypothetical protein